MLAGNANEERVNESDTAPKARKISAATVRVADGRYLKRTAAVGFRNAIRRRLLPASAWHGRGAVSRCRTRREAYCAAGLLSLAGAFLCFLCLFDMCFLCLV